MERIDILKLLAEQLKNSKDLSLNDNEDIIYNYQGVKYIIEWNKNYTYRFGEYVVFFCYFIKNFTIKKTQNIRNIVVTLDSVEKSHKILIRKIKTLTGRIRIQVEIDDFISKSKKESTQKILNFFKKKLDFNSISNMNIHHNEYWYNYKQHYPTTKIVRMFNYLNVSVKFKYNNSSYFYKFKCEFPSKWSDVAIKKITLLQKEETFNNKQIITNIIRYAKLKNILKNG